MDIDLVYLWVNGNDPAWKEKHDVFIGHTTDTNENCEGRYADSGELKYSLRSAEKYAPWIRRIFIVTDNQVPQWLDTSNPRIQIVDHTEILPAESLPCFNSIVIEQYLHRIPGLADHFLYANDDTYFYQTATPNTFFADDGKPYLFMNRKPFRKTEFWVRKHIIGKPLGSYLQTIQNASMLVQRHYGKYYGDKLHHNIDAYTKDIFSVVDKIFHEELSGMKSHHMRSNDDIQRVFYSYVARAENLGHVRFVSRHHSFRLHIEKRWHYDKLKRYNPVLFCMNDSEYATNEDRKFAIDFLSRLFPDKSQFEK